MLPDDPRHGTTAGHQAHLQAGESACVLCVAAKTRYEKSRKVYGDRMVPAIGTRRRIQALKALGHSGADIAKPLGVTYQAVHKLEHGTSDKVFAATAEKVAVVFEQMCMVPAIGYHQRRMRNQALARGYLPPLAWDDIDNDPEPPTVETAGNWEDQIDHAVVRRILDGDKRPRKLTHAEVAEIVRVLLGRGMSTHQIERDYGFKTDRYRRQESAA